MQGTQACSLEHQKDNLEKGLQGQMTEELGNAVTPTHFKRLTVQINVLKALIYPTVNYINAD